jgi:thiosulfate sulfurtransferase
MDDGTGNGESSEDSGIDAIPEIDVGLAAARVGDGRTVFMDVRDPGSYLAAHVPGARRVDDSSIGEFLRTTDRGRPVIIYCYHGHSSLGGAAFLLEQGFREVFSLRGGFEAWRGQQPHESG